MIEANFRTDPVAMGIILMADRDPDGLAKYEAIQNQHPTPLIGLIVTALMMRRHAAEEGNEDAAHRPLADVIETILEVLKQTGVTFRGYDEEAEVQS